MRYTNCRDEIEYLKKSAQITLKLHHWMCFYALKFGDSTNKFPSDHQKILIPQGSRLFAHKLILPAKPRVRKWRRTLFSISSLWKLLMMNFIDDLSTTEILTFISVTASTQYTITQIYLSLTSIFFPEMTKSMLENKLMNQQQWVLSIQWIKHPG